MKVQGRWTLIVDFAGNAVLPNLDPRPGDKRVPVVPCDDAAIERGAKAIEAEVKWYGLDNWSFDEVAEWVLRAAGETP